MQKSVLSLLVFAFVMMVASAGLAEEPAKAPPQAPAASAVKGPSGDGPMQGKDCPCMKGKHDMGEGKDCPHMKGKDCPCAHKDGEAHPKDCPCMKGKDGEAHPKDCPCMKGKDGEAKDCPHMKGMDGKGPHMKGKDGEGKERPRMRKGKGGDRPKPDQQPAK
jgi:hypothetical protein